MFLEGILQRPSRCLSVFKRHVLQRSSYNFCEDVVAIFAQISPREVAVNRLWRGSCESLAQSSWGTVAKVPCTVLFTEGLPRSCQRPCTIPFQKVFGQTFKSILGQSKRVHAKRSCTNSAMKTCAEILSPHLSQFWGPLARHFSSKPCPKSKVVWFNAFFVLFLSMFLPVLPSSSDASLMRNPCFWRNDVFCCNIL